VVLVRAAAASPTKVASLLTLIHRSAWKVNSQKLELRIVHRESAF
jgi:hypothetical protein